VSKTTCFPRFLQNADFAFGRPDAARSGDLRQALAVALRTHDMALTALLHPELAEGDVLIGARAFCSFVHLALLAGRKLQGVFRAHQKQIIDFRPHRAHNGPGRGRGQKGRPNSRWPKRLGVQDQLVEYFRPKRRPDWMSPEDYAALPASVVVRELRYRIPNAPSRTREVTLVTTLLDAEVYPGQDLAELYRQRWTIATNLRHLKQTMNMDVLHCETVAGVHKELTIFALAYNLVRAVMAQAAQRQQVPPRTHQLCGRPGLTDQCQTCLRTARPKSKPQTAASI